MSVPLFLKIVNRSFQRQSAMIVMVHASEEKND